MSQTTINAVINQTNINGQIIGLAAPIRLSGAINRDALLLDIGNIKEQSEQLLQLGVDEAGRGPLLGDVVVAAVVLPADWSDEISAQPLKETPLALLTDSKKLSESKREVLFPLIKQLAVGFVIAEVPAEVIDQVNILQATLLGMQLSSEYLAMSILESLPVDCPKDVLKLALLFDGNRCPKINMTMLTALGMQRDQIDCQAWIKGDGRQTSIAAASILAKVSRDRGMYELASQYPQFMIERHKGYPTKAHLAAIAAYGVLPQHRRSFAPIRRALERQSLY